MRHRLQIFGQRLIEQQLPAFLVTKATNIRYLTGYSGQDAQLLILPSGDAFFITDFRNLEQAEQETQGLPITFARCSPQIHPERIIKDYCTRYGCASIGIEKDALSYGDYEKLVDALGRIEVVPCPDLIAPLRAKKDAQEQGFLQRAAAIADQAYRLMLEKVAPGLTELQLAAYLEYQMVSLGAEEPAFPTIVAAGAHGSQCHARPSDKQLQRGEFVTVDFGATYQGYRSDCTRTFILGVPTSRQKDVYDLVLETKNASQERVQPGAICKMLHLAAAQQLADGGYGPYFGHGLGHGVGLDIHEAPTLNQNSHALLEAGQVITIEPGLYLPKWGGVRIEDTLIVGEQHNIILSDLPTTLLVID